MYFPHRVFPNNKRSIRSCHVKCRVCVHSTFEHVGLSCCYSLIGDCLVSLESLLYSIIFRKVLFFLMNFSILFFPPISLSTQISTSFELLFASVKQANFSPSRFEISSNKRSILISSKFFSFFLFFFLRTFSRHLVYISVFLRMEAEEKDEGEERKSTGQINISAF